jgi:hypothetical protein
MYCRKNGVLGIKGFKIFAVEAPLNIKVHEK